LNFLTVAAEAFGYSLSVDEGAYIFSGYAQWFGRFAAH